MKYRQNYINFLNSNILDPSIFPSFEDFMLYCNISCIMNFDFLDIELTKKICEKRWLLQHLKNLKFKNGKIN